MEERCIIYFSKSTRLSNEVDLLTLLQQSRHNNAKENISGVLLYVRGSIVQVLEGETLAVETLFGRIEQDKRHTNVTRVLNRLITERLFSDWTMGYETVTSHQMADIKRMIAPNKNQEITSAKQEAILRMLRAFYEGNHYN